jgi:hypothetical protein
MCVCGCVGLWVGGLEEEGRTRGKRMYESVPKEPMNSRATTSSATTATILCTRRTPTPPRTRQLNRRDVKP